MDFDNKFTYFPNFGIVNFDLKMEIGAHDCVIENTNFGVSWLKVCVSENLDQYIEIDSDTNVKFITTKHIIPPWLEKNIMSQVL